MSKGCKSFLMYVFVALISPMILSGIFPNFPWITILFFFSWIFGYPIYKIVQYNKKLAIQHRHEEERKKLLKQQEEEFSKQKEAFLGNLLKWESEGITTVRVENPILAKNNNVYFLSERFLLKSARSGDFTPGTFMLIDKEVCFLSERITKSIPYSQTLKLDIGPFELKFTSKNSTTPLRFLCLSQNAYQDRLEIAEAYAKWYLLNGFEIKDFMPDLEKVFSFPMSILHEFIIKQSE